MMGNELIFSVNRVHVVAANIVAHDVRNDRD